MAAPTDADHAAWKREAAKVPAARVREVVTREMPQHEAEEECVKRFGMSLEVAIYFVCGAIDQAVIGLRRGSVRPEVEPCTCPNMPCPRHSDFG